MAQQYAVDIVVKASGADQIAKLEKALKSVTSSSKAVDNQAEQVAMSLQKLRKASTQAAAGVTKVGAASRTASAGVKTLGTALKSTLAPLVAVSTAVGVFKTSLDAAFSRDAAEKRLKNLSASTEDYKKSLDFVAQSAEKFRQSQTQTTQAFGDLLGRLQPLGLSLNEIKDVYTGFNTVAAQSGTTAEDAAGAMLQLSQAMGSGALQGDELRSILERMPQLAAAIAETMNVAAGDIKKLGSEGKITTQVLVKAFSQISSSSQGLDLKDTLTPSQLAMQELRRATEELQVALGEGLLPMLVPIAEGMTEVANQVTRLLQNLSPLGQAVQTLAGSFAGLNGEAGATADTFNIQVIPVIGTLYEILLTTNRVIEAVAGAWASLKGMLGLGDVTSGVEKFNEGLQQAEENSQGVAKQIQQQTSEQTKLNKKSGEGVEMKKLEAAATKELAAAQKEYQTALGGEQGNIEQELSVKQAILTAEKDINNAKLQQAQADLQSAQTQAEKEAAAQRIYTATVKNAQLEYAAAISAAQAEQQKVAAALRHAEILAQKQRVLLAEAEAADRVTQAHRDAVAEANRGIQVAQDAVAAQNAITAAVTASAAAQRDAKTQAAQTAIEAQKITSNTAAATGQAQALAGAFREAASAAASVGTAAASAGGGGGGGGGGGSTGSTFTNNASVIPTFKVDPQTGKIERVSELERKIAINQKKAAVLNKAYFDRDVFDAVYSGSDYMSMAMTTRERGGMIGPVGSSLYETYYGLAGSTAGQDYNVRTINDVALGNNIYNYLGYAEGGYVTGPQQAIVGEGGEPEYIIPESKMNAAMARYGAGQRGDSVIPDSATVNVNYGGSTVSMGGSEYINKADVPGLLNSAVNQTLKTLRRNSSSRLYAGFDR